MQVPLVLVAVLAPEARLEAAVLDALGLKPGDADLLAYVASHTPGPPSDARVGELVRQLGAPDFQDREEAQAALARGGPAIVPAVRAARSEASPEQARRIDAVLRRVEADWSPKNAAAYRAAVRAVARRNPDGAIPVLLKALPFLAEDDELLAAAWEAIDAATVKAGAIPPVCLAAETDPDPGRRALAAFLLGRRGTEAQRREAAGMFNDPAAAVRLRAAQGLLGAGDMCGVPTLIALLEARPLTLAWEAEELLIWLAGKDAPQVLVADGEAGAAVRQAWAVWWGRARDGLDWAAVAGQARRPTLLLLRDRVESGSTPRPTVLVGCDGRERWTACSPAARLSVHGLSHTGRAFGLTRPEPDLPKRSQWDPAPAYAISTPGTAELTAGRSLAVSGYDELAVCRWAGGQTLIAGTNRFAFVPDGRSEADQWASVPAITKRPDDPARPTRDTVVGERWGVLWYRLRDFLSPDDNLVGIEPGSGTVVFQDPSAAATVRHQSVDTGRGEVIAADGSRGRVGVADRRGGVTWEIPVRRGPSTPALALPLVRVGFGHAPRAGRPGEPEPGSRPR